MFRIGHAKLTLGYLMAIEEPSTCQTSGIQLTIKHIQTERRQYEIQRKNNIPNQPHKILGPQQTKKYNF